MEPVAAVAGVAVKARWVAATGHGDFGEGAFAVAVASAEDECRRSFRWHP